jgi:HSP20 family protein
MARGKSNSHVVRTKNAGTKKVQKHDQMVRKQETDQETDTVSWLRPTGNLVRRFRSEIDRLFQDFGLDNLALSLPGAEAFPLGLWAPEVEVFERGGQIVVRADLPGLTKDDIKIDVTESTITIEGERRQEHDESNDDYYRSERSYGRFSRRIPLPEGVEVETAKAQFRDGVLEIDFALPERKERRVRKLEIVDDSARGKARAAGN